MMHPKTLKQQPGMGTVLLGGMAATIPLSALVLLALEYGFLDFSRLVGGLFTANETIAFWLGFWLIFAGGVLLFPPLLGILWDALPGEDVGLKGALIKGASLGVVIWFVTGVLLPLCDVLNRLTAPLVSGIGFFALAHGLSGPAWLALGAIGYGISLALVSAMSQGIVPLDLLGWEGYRPGESQQEAVY